MCSYIASTDLIKFIIANVENYLREQKTRVVIIPMTLYELVLLINEISRGQFYSSKRNMTTGR